jgi:hypothetical protein
MNFAKQIHRYAVSFIAAVVVAACSSQQEPARHAVDTINVALSSVGQSVQKYMPDQYAALQARAASLKDSVDKGNYQQVLDAAPTLMNDIQQMGAVAAAKKAQRVKTMSEQWPRFTAYIPDTIAAVQARIDVLTKNKKDAAKVDLPTAQADMTDVNTLWSRAQQAFSAGDAETAGETVGEVQNKLKAAAAAINFTLPRTAGAAPATASAPAPGATPAH